MFGRKSKPQDFWRWFAAHEEMLYNFERDQETTFDKLATQLQRIDRHLAFEFGPKVDNRREFVISAGGIRDAFPVVIALVTAASRLERWQITAFRPRRPPAGSIELRGKTVDASKVQFSLRDNGKIIGIDLFLPDYDEKEVAWQEIGYLFLDEALGEYDMETKVGPIRMFPCNQPVQGERFMLSELPEIFDRHILTLERRNNIDFMPPEPS